MGVLGRLFHRPKLRSRPSRFLLQAPGSCARGGRTLPPPRLPPPPGGGGPWRACSLAAAPARAGAGSADWPARLGGAREPRESLGEAGQRPGAAGAQSPHPASQGPADQSPHVRPGLGGKREAPGRVGRALARGTETKSFGPAPREQKRGIFSQKHGSHPPKTWVPFSEKRGSPTSQRANSFFFFFLQKWTLPLGPRLKREDSAP